MSETRETFPIEVPMEVIAEIIQNPPKMITFTFPDGSSMTVKVGPPQLRMNSVPADAPVAQVQIITLKPDSTEMPDNAMKGEA